MGKGINLHPSKGLSQKGTQPIVTLWPGKYKSMKVELVQHECQNQESIISVYNHSSPLNAQSSHRTIIFMTKNFNNKTIRITLSHTLNGYNTSAH